MSRCSHNPEVAGSNPAPATNQEVAGQRPNRQRQRSGLLVICWWFVGETGPPSAAAGGRKKHETASRNASGGLPRLCLTTPLSGNIARWQRDSLKAVAPVQIRSGLHEK